MWFFSKKHTLEESGLLKGATDWHSHILPGVDDGVSTMEESLKILSIYEQQGVKKLWLTPHIMEDIPNTVESLRERFAELKDAYKGSIELCLASENMLDTLFEKRLKDNDVLPIGNKGQYLLVETSFFNPPMDMFSIMERIKSRGYYPLLAHPERYLYMEKKDYARLKEMGVRFQLNYISLQGMYGKDVQKRAKSLLKSGYYNCAGSDLHRIAALQRNLESTIDPCDEKVKVLFE